jgi:hypothetical protein
MAKDLKRCRVCGKTYEACRSTNRSASVFRWQEVACSPECGAVYLQRIEASRTPAEPEKKRKRKALEVEETASVAVESIAEAVEEAAAETVEPWGDVVETGTI